MDEEVSDGKVSLEVPRKAATLDFGVLRKAELALLERVGDARREKQPTETQRDVYWPGAGKPNWKSRLGSMLLASNGSLKSANAPGRRLSPVRVPKKSLVMLAALNVLIFGMSPLTESVSTSFSESRVASMLAVRPVVSQP